MEGDLYFIFKKGKIKNTPVSRAEKGEQGRETESVGQAGRAGSEEPRSAAPRPARLLLTPL